MNNFKVGDLVTPKSSRYALQNNIVYSIPIFEVPRYPPLTAPANAPKEKNPPRPWRIGEVGMILGAYDQDANQYEVLFNDQPGWVDSEKIQILEIK
jgi:hypothetical protein